MGMLEKLTAGMRVDGIDAYTWNRFVDAAQFVDRQRGSNDRHIPAGLRGTLLLDLEAARAWGVDVNVPTACHAIFAYQVQFAEA